MANSSRKYKARVCSCSSAVVRSFSSPAGSAAVASPFASSSAVSSFAYSSSDSFLPHRSASPTRVSLAGSSPPPRTPSFRFFLERSTSPGRSLAASTGARRPAHAPARRTCMCSPTTHPGSFRCSLHKGLLYPAYHHQHAAASSPSNRLTARRSAMTNSLVRIGAVEGEWMKRALATLIRPSSHHRRRRFDFRPRPSRLSVMSKAEDL